MADRIDEILQARRKLEKPDEAEPSDGDKFFSIPLAEGLFENFLELRHANGMLTCFNYTDLSWFTYDPEAGAIDLAFGGFAITLKGRGLQPLFQGIKQKRVAWVKEADTDMQDHQGNESFVEEIMIRPPKGFAGEEETEES